MMLSELLSTLTRHDVRLRAVDGELVIRAPKGAVSPELSRRITEHKDRILTLLRRQTGLSDSASLPQIIPDAGGQYDPFPLTDIQQAYWLGRNPSCELGQVGIHVYEELDCPGLDSERLNRAWQSVIDRHGMLRAVVLSDGRQIIRRQASSQIEVLDWRGRSTDEQADLLHAMRERLSHRVYDPTEWPQFEIVACRLDEKRTRLFISIDALNIDMGSFALIFKEWAQFYENPQATPEPPGLSFRDYVLALGAVRESENYRRSLNYWRARSARLPPAPRLPMAKEPGSLSRQLFTRRRGGLDSAAWPRLKQMAAHAGLTPSGILLAAYAEVLALWGGSRHFTLNVTLFNRLPLHPEVNALVGDFTSMIMLEVNGSADDTFEGRCKALQRQFWEDLEHRYLSGVQVLREVAAAQRKTLGTLLMPVVFTSTLNLQTQGLLPLKRLGERVYNLIQTPQVSLDLQVYEECEALVFNWDCVEELFPAGLMDDMFEAYCALLQSLSAGEEAWQTKRLPLVPDKQLRRRAANQVIDTSLTSGSVNNLFAAQAERQPTEVAVVAPGRSLTYGELSRCSRKIAGLLHQSGAARNTLVAVVMEKGWEQVLAVLGILQSGAAYVPIDPSLPPQRLSYLIENSRVTQALTQSWIDEKLSWPANVRRVCVDQEDSWTGIEVAASTPAPGPHDLAYVLYTSGSTGEPKGVMIEHRSIVNRVKDVNARFRIGPGDKVLALTALHHDLSVYDVFGVLAAGGTIVMPAAERLLDPSHWAGLIAGEQVTLWNSVPAFMEMLVGHLEQTASRFPDPLRSLRLALLSGDWIPLSLPKRIKSLSRKVSVIGLGGPTETTVWDICHPIEDVQPDWKSIPYGRPMANTQYHVLSESLETCPDWVAGELCIEGAGLARGYWRDEEKTRASFINHPVTKERLYRSGDVGRYLPDGNIEFLGRKDFQLKIRGYRIEAGEVEQAIKRHEAVCDAIVAAVGEPGRDKRLVAYVVPKQRAASSTNGSPADKRASEHERYKTERAGLHEVELAAFKLSKPGVRKGQCDRPHVQLEGAAPSASLIRQYVRRRSFRAFQRLIISFEQFSGFVGSLRGVELNGLPLPKYRYPSGGSLYPVQTCFYIKPERVEGVPSGVYYYHPLEHRLVLLSDSPLPREIHVHHNLGIFDGSAFSVFFIGNLEAVQPVYGNAARDFCLLEAGCMSQLLMSEAPAFEIGLCPIGDMDFPSIRAMFELSENHIYLHSMVGGRISVDQIKASPSEMSYARGDGSGGNGHKPLADELRDSLIEQLPTHMLPSTFVLLDAFPLTPNGKVDRLALPPPDEDATPATVACAEPETEMESFLVGVVRGVIGIEHVGVHHRFFELGANSIHMVEILSKIQTALGRDVSMTEIFRFPTVSALAKYLSSEQEAEIPVESSATRAATRRSSLEHRRRANT